MKSYWENLSEETRKIRYKQNNETLNGKNGEKSSKRIKNYWVNLSAEDYERHCKINKINGSKSRITDKCIKARSENCRIAGRIKLLNNAKIVVESIIESGLSVNESSYNTFRKSGDPLYKTALNLGIFNNHKVILVENIEYPEPIPVYDLTVDKYNNFFVDAGVVLHNCYRFAYWASEMGYKYGEQETRPSKITNPNDKLGAMCKHLTSLLVNKRWLRKTASILNTFIKQHVNEITIALDLPPDMFANEPGRPSQKTGRNAKMFRDPYNDDELLGATLALDEPDTESYKKESFMPTVEYIVVFKHKDGSLDEEVGYNNKEDALEHFELFADDEDDIYSEISVVKYDHETKEEKLIKSISFD